MKLYQIPKGSKIKVEEGFVTFHRIDGMYSYCTAEWLEENNVIHFSATMPVKIEKDYYVIDDK